MTDLAASTDLNVSIVKEEPTTDLNACIESKSAHDEASTEIHANGTQLSLMNSSSTIPPLPPLSATPNTSNALNSNPFGPCYAHKSIQAPFPPPFSATSMPSIAPLTNSFPPHAGYHASFGPSTHTPFPAVPFPNNANDPTRAQHPYPIPNPMFYTPVFGQQQAPYNEYNNNNGDNNNNNTNNTSSSSATPPNDTPPNNTSSSSKTGGSTSKPYTFTPGMQPGAYYLIPLNTPNGQSSHHHHHNNNNNNKHAQHQPMTPYMPLINQTESKTDTNNTQNEECVAHNRTQAHSTNTNSSDTTSPTDDDESDSENENDSDSNENAVNDRLQYQATQPFLYHGSSTMNAPFLNVLSPISHSQSGAPPHLPFSIPLTPTNHAIATNTRDTHQFPPPPPLPLPYPDLNHLNNTQFSLAPIVSSVGMNDNDKIQNNEDKKNIIMTEKSNKNGDNSVLPSFIMRQQTQPLSFPPLPTNSHMNDNNNNMNHLNSNFAANMNDDLNETMLTACAERERDDSTDHDMDVALGTINHHHDTMPIIQNNNDINPTYYHNITPFDQPHNISVAKKRKARKTRTRHKISPKKSTKRIRKHNNRRKVKATAIIDDCTSISSSNNYQNISVHVPALNKMRLSPSKIQHNGRIAITRTSKKRCNASATNIVNIPNLSDNEHAAAASNTNHSILNMRTDSSQEIDGQMEVAYSQQYPQVGFPYIFNSDGENGKKFTCKFMDAISIIDGTPGFCDRQFGQKCHWMRHCLEKHVPTEMSQRYQCRECNMKYAQNSSLKEHFAICHSGQPPSFKCPYCSGDITFTRWTSVLRHCRNQHPDQEEPQKQMRASLRVTNSSKHTSADREKTKNKRVRMRKKNKQNKNNNHNHNNHNNNNGADENTNNSNNSNNSNNCMMDLDDATFCTMPPLNIMPSVNMNISMNQMLSNNHHPAFVAGVAILPPDMHRNHNGNAIG